MNVEVMKKQKDEKNIVHFISRGHYWSNSWDISLLWFHPFLDIIDNQESTLISREQTTAGGWFRLLVCTVMRNHIIINFYRSTTAVIYIFFFIMRLCGCIVSICALSAFSSFSFSFFFNPHWPVTSFKIVIKILRAPPYFSFIFKNDRQLFVWIEILI